MTCNQAIVLMDVYRGFDRERHPEGVSGDLAYLAVRDLVRLGDEVEYEVTEEGDRVVRGMLDVGDLDKG